MEINFKAITVKAVTKHMANFSAPIALILLASVLMFSCGQSDPRTDYKELVDRSVPAQDYKPAPPVVPIDRTPEAERYRQTVAANQNFEKQQQASDFPENVFPAPTIKGSDRLAFVQGELKTYTLSMPVQLPVGQYQLMIEDLPEGASMTQTSESLYELKWRPENVVTKEAPTETFKFKVRLTVKKFKNQASFQAYEKANKVHELTLTVTLSPRGEK